MMMTREEHLQECKRRANEYLKAYDVPNAITSMLSDLGKHPDTKAAGESMAMLGMLYIVNRDMDGARRFIDGFR